ncbi:hypothetical protein [Rhizobium sp. MHM7A]|uniref:hypothetical protein n=1 Tax=Rhizobium sp. MHM7A TaxID=2583233 RepID=UPI0011070500|nr:hypothetical protein [Rhizobium sp. MHM7A]TLX17203.1 hypothetical protein FFR93_07790 [Rhizobium sp. MHM7A]
MKSEMDIEQAKAALKRALGADADGLLAGLGTDVIKIDDVIAALSVVRKDAAERCKGALRLTQSLWPYNLLRPAAKVNVIWTAEDEAAEALFELVYNFGFRRYSVRDANDQSRFFDDDIVQKVYALLPENEIAQVKQMQSLFDARSEQPKLRRLK